MKFISSFIFCLIVILIGVNVNAAKVNNVDVYYENGKTCAAIEVDGTIRFTHQIEDAKDGKPFRIIVDILSATHNLGAKSFVNLPKSSILKIRSSQYCVKPENVVRVVFDMAHESVYSIDLSGNVIKVSIPDKSTKSFERWSSKKFLAGLKPKKESKQKLAVKKETKKQSKTFAQINNSIEKDRLASLGSNKTKKQTKTTVKIVAKESKQNYGPKFDSKLLADASHSKIKTEKKEATKKVAIKPIVTTKKVNKLAVKKAVEPKKTDNSKVVKGQVKKGPAPKPKTEQKTVYASKSNFSDKKEAVQKSKTVVTKSDKKSTLKKNKVVAQTTKKKNPSTKTKTVALNTDKKKSENTKTTVAKVKKKKSNTSRFRRSATENRKIKGTMVAEFPRRLVIKYKTRLNRDPFETLINETKINNSLIQKKLPNVEGLKLVGIIDSETEKNRALFEDADGFGYILKSGDKVKKGYVLRVENDKVYFQIFEYGWSRTVALNLEE